MQLGLLPSHDRVLPETLELAHDYAAWFREMVAIKESPERDQWTELLPRLGSYGPAQFTIDDPGEVARAAIGCNIELHGFGLNWEFESPIRRAFIAKERTVSTLGAIYQRTRVAPVPQVRRRHISHTNG